MFNSFFNKFIFGLYSTNTVKTVGLMLTSGQRKKAYFTAAATVDSFRSQMNMNMFRLNN